MHGILGGEVGQVNVEQGKEYSITKLSQTDIVGDFPALIAMLTRCTATRSECVRFIVGNSEYPRTAHIAANALLIVISYNVLA